MKYRLELGCGEKLEDGWIGVDKVNYGHNIIWDVEKNGLEIFPDYYFSRIRAIAFLEHIAQDKVIYVLNECRRVLERSGTLEILVPRWDTPGAYSDPTHVSRFDIATFTEYFSGNEPLHRHYGIDAWNIDSAEELKRNIKVILSRP